MTNFNERTNTLLYKNIISHSLFSKGWWLLSVRDELETETDCYFDLAVLLTRAALFSHLGWGCSTVGHWEPQALSLQADSLAGIQSPIDSNRPRAPGYIIVLRPPVSAVLPLIYTGAFLDWRLGQGSIYNNHPILIFQNSTCGIFLHVRLHPPHTHILQIMLKDNNSKNTKRNYLNYRKKQKS